MKVINPAKRAELEPAKDLTAAKTDLLAALANKAEMTFDDLRKRAALAGLTDGEMHQAAIDAGLEVEREPRAALLDVAPVAK